MSLLLPFSIFWLKCETYSPNNPICSSPPSALCGALIPKTPCCYHIVWCRVVKCSVMIVSAAVGIRFDLRGFSCRGISPDISWKLDAGYRVGLFWESSAQRLPLHLQRFKLMFWACQEYFRDIRTNWMSICSGEICRKSRSPETKLIWGKAS